MELEKKINKLIIKTKKPILKIDKLIAPSPWKFTIECHTNENEIYTIKNLKTGDDNLIIDFKSALSQRSKNLFCPYPWNNSKLLNRSITDFLEKCEKKINVGYILLYRKKPIGHFFLWGAGGNEQSKKFDINVPELGVAVADKFQGKGWGKLFVEILKLIAQYLKCDAIELTTSITNQGGYETYIKSGFIFTGLINNPLETDTTAIDQSFTKKNRREKQMIYIINTKKEGEIFNYLSFKRKEYEKLALQ